MLRHLKHRETQREEPEGACDVRIQKMSSVRNMEGSLFLWKTHPLRTHSHPTTTGSHEAAILVPTSPSHSLAPSHPMPYLPPPRCPQGRCRGHESAAPRCGRHGSPSPFRARTPSGPRWHSQHSSPAGGGAELRQWGCPTGRCSIQQSWVHPNPIPSFRTHPLGPILPLPQLLLFALK